MSKVIIIGAGPSGMMAAIKASENNEVILLEKNNEVGKKLNITGKGRCNISFVGDKEDFLDNVVTNSKFLISAFSLFDNKSLVEYVENLGVKTKEERGKRVFLTSDNAKELTDKLYKELKKRNINICTNAEVEKILVKNDKIYGAKIKGKDTIKCDSIIICTGGKSYPGTGSTGDGYRLSEELGHDIVEIRPALVPLKIKEIDVCKKLQGLTLKNVNIKVIDYFDNKHEEIYADFGEMVFTHFGISRANYFKCK